MNEKRFKLAYEKGNEAIFEDLAHSFSKRLTNKEVEKLLNEQQSFIDLLFNELVEAQKQGYVVNFLHKNEHCSLIPKEIYDERKV